jgi:hypothetical protein
MNILTTLFVFIAYGLFASMYNGGIVSGIPALAFNAPGIDFVELPDDCSGFTDALFCIGIGVINFAIGIVYIILLIVEIIRLLVSIVVLITTNSFTGFDGAPFWVNTLFLTAIFGSFAISIYKAIRKGDTDSA